MGETGGKDCIFAHPSADVEPLVAALVRGSFEFQGQKCSACSRAFIPASIWPQVKQGLKEKTAALKVGDVQEFDTFMAAVIDQASFQTCKGYIDRAAASPECEIVAGGTYDDSKGWFVQPTVIRCDSPYYESMVREIFGPILSIYVYEDSQLDETLRICDTASPMPSPARCLPRTARPSLKWSAPCATPAATSTSTTSVPAPSLASSPSAGPGPPAPMTRPAPA